MKKRTLITVCVLLMLSVGLTAAAINFLSPSKTDGSFERDVVDRVDISVENTHFELEKTAEGTEYYKLRLRLNAQKTQADFYAVINRVYISGIDCSSIIFTSLTPGCEGDINGTVLSASDGIPVKYSWDVEVNIPVIYKGEYTPCLNVDFTSGMTKETSDEHILEIPLGISVK